MSRPGADERLRRILAFVPWVAANEGPTVEEVCRRFGMTEAQLTADLELLFLTGVEPFSPDTMVEVDVADGRVWIRFADWFSRPLALTPAEGLALVAAGSALLATPGTDPEGPLARALAKLAAVLGVDPDEVVDIELGEAPPAVLAVLHRAAAETRQVAFDYYSYGRDAWARRTVDPHRVFSAGGQWYVAAYCHTAAADRLFRVDRVREPVLLEATFPRPAREPSTAVFSPRPDDPVVVLDLVPEGRWVPEQYPVERVEHHADGRLTVALRVGEQAWLERLLLRLGAHARVVSGDASIAASAAARVLQRYRSGTVR